LPVFFQRQGRGTGVEDNGVTVDDEINGRPRNLLLGGEV
jgi:hypothetical protein